MKRKISIIGRVGCIALGLSLLSLPVFAATDYSSVGNEEMAEMRGTMRDASQDDRDAFRSEWQSRVNNMSQGEMQSATGRPANAAQDGYGNMNGGGSGSGGGMGKGRR